MPALLLPFRLGALALLGEFPYRKHNSTIEAVTLDTFTVVNLPFTGGNCVLQDFPKVNFIC